MTKHEKLVTPQKVAKLKKQETFSAAQPLDADRIARMTQWCNSHYETTCISGAAGLDMLATLISANARIARLEEALKPFARAAEEENLQADVSDNCMVDYSDGLVVGDLRRARAALKGDA